MKKIHPNRVREIPYGRYVVLDNIRDAEAMREWMKMRKALRKILFFKPEEDEINKLIADAQQLFQQFPPEEWREVSWDTKEKQT